MPGSGDLGPQPGAGRGRPGGEEKKGELEPLTCEEAFSVHIYTQDSWFYKEVNRLLRLRDRANLKPVFPYLKLILTGLHRLKPIDDTVFHGVRLDLELRQVCRRR
jgi:hypothetical protein